MTFEDAVKLTREVFDYYSRRLEVIALGTFGKANGDWGVSVYIDGNKERRKVLWCRNDLAAFNGDLVRLCACGWKREMHVESCECGSGAFEVVQRTYSPEKRSAAVERDETPAGMLF